MLHLICCKSCFSLYGWVATQFYQIAVWVTEIDALHNTLGTTAYNNAFLNLVPLGKNLIPHFLQVIIHY